VKPARTAPTLADFAATQKQGRYLAVITMKSGKTIELVLEGSYMPYTVANFVNLAQAKFYDGVTFHRVEPGFVIQGGDPKGNGSGDPGYSINLEISPLIRHMEGAISMARATDLNSAGCQFFITLGPTPFLDGTYAVFGWVKSGMNVVNSVKVGDVMQSVTVAPYAGTEICPLLAPKIKAK
ncbi:MAG TPA: peptidylprolyl isomerase, partial [Armatimonadota bacterium]